MNNASKDLQCLLEQIETLGKDNRWYHKIDLGNGVVTPGFDYDDMWNATRKTIDSIDYCNKSVLDIASWDGMWAFEAEKRGASQVFATDLRLPALEKFLFVRQQLGSSVIPLYNVPVQELSSRVTSLGSPLYFDVVQHLGLFYHLRDPMLSLAQCRKVMNVGGYLVLETAFIDDDENSYMMFNGTKNDGYRFYGHSDTWAPTLRCLKEILVRTFFEPVQEKVWSKIMQDDKVSLGRITLVARAMSQEEGHMIDWDKVMLSR